ncbi:MULTISPECIES: hypothetical protein [Rhodococcus]|uniref:Uncharacterized protein n=1 Tax=Rhodococcus jostii TaxID=132919 RepID=A0ABU4CBC6_RHOJO|nr:MULTISPECIES: hypothetical protein [Rhodococcus]MDI9973464.1 hypothetical protein [Rhodococcus sp. IEGM 1307]MDV6280845.1 hypothetical protein [Rhodococcus jostii]
MALVRSNAHRPRDRRGVGDGGVTVLPGQGAPWAPDGIVAPVAPGVYANFIP